MPFGLKPDAVLNPAGDLTGYDLDRRVTVSLERAPPQVASRE